MESVAGSGKLQRYVTVRRMDNGLYCAGVLEGDVMVERALGVWASPDLALFAAALLAVKHDLPLAGDPCWSEWVKEGMPGLSQSNDPDYVPFSDESLFHHPWLGGKDRDDD